MKFYGERNAPFQRQDVPVAQPWQPTTQIVCRDPDRQVGETYLVFPTRMIPDLIALLQDEGWEWDGNPRHPKYVERYSHD